MFNLWKKIGPDSIWLAPALILMLIQSIIAEKGYISLEAELIVIYFALGLLFIGSWIGLLKPIQKRIDRGVMAEAAAFKYRKLYFYVVALLIGIYLVNLVSIVVR
jgi:hypothetical protein